MTTARDLIEEAYRETNHVGLGSLPDPLEMTEGLRLLQNLFLTMHGLVLGHKYRPWYVPFPTRTAPKGGDFPALFDKSFTDSRDVRYPPVASRVIVRSRASETLFMPQMPSDGALVQIVDAGFEGTVTLSGNGAFFGASDIQQEVVIPPRVSGGSRVPTRTYMYRADLAAWVRLDDLQLDVDTPYPDEFDEFWTTSLAFRLTPRHGQEPRSVTIARNREMTLFIRGWYRLENQETLVSDTRFNTTQSYQNGDNYGSFETGA